MSPPPLPGSGPRKLAARMALTFALLWATWTPSQASDTIPVSVVVVTAFELGKDSGDAPGEFQNWVTRLPLSKTLPFPQGYRSLRYNPDLKVLGVVTGEGAVHAAASIMALGMDPRFDLSHAYWVVAGIAGVDPNAASVASAAWAEWVVDRDLNYEIDPRDAPPDWSTGHIPLGRSKPFAKPAPQRDHAMGTNAYHLNAGLADWAYRLTAGVKLEDTKALKTIRAGYPNYPEARKPPFVLKGDDLAASDFWLGSRMNTLAQQWTKYWTGDKGTFVMTAMEDAGTLQALTFLDRAKRVDLDRVMVLRTASDYTIPPAGQDAAQLLAAEGDPNGQNLSAYLPAIGSAFEVGSVVVKELARHWDKYREAIPGHRDR